MLVFIVMYREKNKNSEICPINIVNKQDKGKEMPVTLDLLPRTYLWCTCGMSKNQPFCDGSHAKTEFKPLLDSRIDTG